jgi:hypothetical protein
MIPTIELLYSIDLKLNKVASGKFQNIPLEDKLIALNEAQLRLIKKKVNTNNLYRAGFDAFRSRYEDLENLVVPYEVVTPTKVNESYPGYKVNLNSLSKKYYLPVDIITTSSKGKCKNRLVKCSYLVRHSELSGYIDNPHFRPDFLYQETIGTISSSELTVYSGDFQINQLKISYLRYPNKIDYEGYEHFDGTTSVISNCELPEYLKDELLELAVIELATDTGNFEVAKAAQNKSQNSE